MYYSRRHFIGTIATGIGGMLLNSRFTGAMSVTTNHNLYEKVEGRIIPQLPPPGKKLRLLIDTDAANEIDDL